MPCRIHIQSTERDELPDQPAPVRCGVFGADTEGRQPIVAMPQHAVGAFRRAAPPMMCSAPNT